MIKEFMPYTFISHTADIGFKVWESSLEKLFATAAMALTASVVDVQKTLPQKKVKVVLKAATKEELLVRWLEEVLYLFETRGLVGIKFDVRLDGNQLKGVIEGVEWDEKKQPLKTQIKAVTFHGLEIIETRQGFEVQIILDV